MPERIERIYDRCLLVADHPYFLEIDADRRQIFRNVADVLVLGAAGQDLATDHQERGRDKRPSSRKCTATSSSAVHGTQEHIRQSQFAQYWSGHHGQSRATRGTKIHCAKPLRRVTHLRTAVGTTARRCAVLLNGTSPRLDVKGHAGWNVGFD